MKLNAANMTPKKPTTKYTTMDILAFYFPCFSIAPVWMLKHAF